MNLAYALLGREWRGGMDAFQDHMARDITTPGCAYWIGQAPRQGGGKTEVSALYDAVTVLNGGAVALGLPAKEQAGTVTWKRVIEFLKRFEELGLLAHVGRGTPQHLSEWSTKVGGREVIGELRIVGARQAQNQARGETKSKNTQTGRTVNVLHLDEGQSLFAEDVQELMPATDVAMTEGVGRINITGVGGPTESIIEARKQTGYRSFWINDEVVRAAVPAFGPIFDERKASETSEFYDANYGCLPLSIGKRTLYPDIIGPQPLPSFAGPAIHIFSIDVGRTRDYTVIAHRVWYPAIDVSIIVAFVEISHGNLIDQARWVYEYIDLFPWICTKHESYISCETNGISQGLADILIRLHEVDPKCAGFPYLIPVNVDEKKIHQAGQGLRVKFRNGKYQMESAARTHRLGDPPRRIDELCYTINERGEYKYQHHDGNSALIVGEVANGMVSGGVKAA